MTGDDPAELVKAAAQGTVEGLIAPISGLLGKLFGEPAAALGGWMGEAVDRRRWKARVRWVLKSQEFLDELGVGASEVPRPILMPILEAMGDEEDDAMGTRWAALLANAVAGGDERVPPSFPAMLRELSPGDARLLDSLYDRQTINQAPAFASDELGLGQGWLLSFENLISRRLAAPGLKAGPVTAEDNTMLRITDRGRAFVAACRPPAPTAEIAASES